MKKARGMKLDELHIGDLNSRAPRHRHAVASRNVGIGRVQINLPATAGGKHDSIRSNGFNLSGLFIQAINTETAVFGRETEFGSGDQINRHMIFH